MGQTAMKKDLRGYLIFTVVLIAIEVFLIAAVFLDDNFCFYLSGSIMLFSFEVITKFWWFVLPLFVIINALSFLLTAKNHSSAIVFSVLGGAVGGFWGMRKRNPKYKHRRAMNYLYIAQIFLLYLMPIINTIICGSFFTLY